MNPGWYFVGAAIGMYIGGRTRVLLRNWSPAMQGLNLVVYDSR